MSTVKSFSLPDEAVTVLNKIPKNERSEFVSYAILEASKQKAKLQAIEAIKKFPRFESEDKALVVDVLRQIRQES